LDPVLWAKTLNVSATTTYTGSAVCRCHRDALQHAYKTYYHAFFLGNPCIFLLDGSSCGKIDSSQKLLVRKNMKNVAGKME